MAPVVNEPRRAMSRIEVWTYPCSANRSAASSTSMLRVAAALAAPLRCGAAPTADGVTISPRSSPGRRLPGDGTPGPLADPDNGVIFSAMPVIDVDTHWESAVFAPGEHPLEPWLDRFPGDPVERLAFGVA